MDSSIPNSSTSSFKCVTLNYEMDSSNEDIDQQVLREAGEQTISAEWSATVSALSSSDTTSSNTYINIETLKECCANPSDTLKDKEDFMVFESSSTAINTSKFNANDTKCHSECKTTAFQKKHKPISQNFSRVFENILNDDSQMEITQNSICLNRFQKRKRLIPHNDEDFIEINNSNYSGLDNVEISMMKSPKFCFSKKKKDHIDIPDYNLSATESVSIADDTNISKIKENITNLPLVVDDSSINIMEVSKAEVLEQKFSRKTINVPDTAFDNIINDSSMISDIALNNKRTSLNEISVSNVNNTPMFSKTSLLNLNHTYDVHINTDSTSFKDSISDDADIPRVKQNTVFKKPSNSSILVNDNSNNMDVSNTEVFTHKFNRKTIDITNSAFDNIINDSSMISDIALNNKKTSLNEISVSNVNNTPMFSKTSLLNLNHTYDVHINTDSTSFKDSISDDADIPRVKQNTVFKKPSNASIILNDSSNSIDVSNTEVFTHKFNRKTIDVADSVFDNIINNSSIITDNTLNNKYTSSNETLVCNVHDTPGFSKIDISNLNYTYDIPTNINTSKIDISITGNNNITKVKQNAGLKKSSKSSFVVNNCSNNVMDISNTEVFTHKFSRKIIDVTNSVFDNIINDSSIISDVALNNKKVSLIQTSVSNVNNTPVFNTMDISNLNHTYDIPIINNTTLLDNVVENDKSMSETPILLKYNTPKSLNLLPLKFNFNNKIGRHSLSYQEKCTSFDGVKKHNISLNTDFMEYTEDKSNTFNKLGGNNNVNIDTHLHISKIQETNKSSQKIQPLDNSLLTNKLNQEQLKLKCSISSNSNNKDLLLPNTTKLLESNEFQKNQSKNSISSNYSNNEGLTLLNSTTGLLESCSSLRNQSRLLTSKDSKSSISNNKTFNLTMEALKSNESQKTQSKDSIISTSSNESLSLTNSTIGSSERRSSSRNKSSLTSKHSTSVISNNDSLTLLSTTVGSLESNESQKTQSMCSTSPSTDNEGLSLINSTTGFSERRSSSRNKSLLTSKHSTSVISNNDSLTLNTTMGSLKNDESQKTQSKRSISPSSDHESLKSTNRRSSSRNKSLTSKHSTSVISNNDSLTLLSTTVGSLESNESQKTQSMRSTSPSTDNEGLSLINSTTGFSERRSSSRNKSSLTSKHSTSVISNNDSLTLNTTMGSLESNESQKTQSKYSISPSYNDSLKSTTSTTGFSERRSSSRNKSSSLTSKHSTSVISNNDSLTLNTTVGSLKNNESQKTQSKRSISPSSDNESLKSTNSTTGFLERRSSSRNKSSSLTSKHSTSVISNNDSLTLNTTVGSLKNNESQKTQSKRSISPSDNESLKSTNRRSSSRNKSSLLTSKHSTSVISNNNSLLLLNTTVGSLESNESQKTQSKRSISPSYNERLKSTNSTIGFSEKRSSPRNKSLPSTSKPSTSSISNNDSTTSLNSTTGLSISGRSAKIQSKHLKSTTLNIEDLSTLNTPTESLKRNVSKQTKLSNVAPIIIDDLTTRNTTAEPFEQNVISIHQSNSSPNISIKTSTNRLILEDDTNYTNKIHSLSSKQENHLHNNIDQVNPNITDGSVVENRSSKIRVLRSSLGINKNKSLLTRSLRSNNNVNKLSTSSTRTSKGVVNFNDESLNNNSDNSLFWTTLPDETTSISNTQNNVNVNTFQTPKSNKLIITENIVNTIKIMSTNKRKSTHPGAFELDDHNDGPLTRSFVTRSCNHSPSILTLVFGGQKISESTSSLTHSLSETIIDQSQVEENIKQKFKSLYKKESWITKRLYKFLIIKLQPNYNIYSVKYAEKFVKYLAMLLKQIHNDKVNLQLYTDMLRYHMARYGIIRDTFDYLGFLSDYIPMAYYKKLVPGWNLETSAVKFDPQKYYIPLMDDEEFLNYIMKHLKEA
ncbi:serine-rich adhesin for platelets-like [Rhopalosiphum padi]|uniref:serine-rich adhesin for platelets-like n=1 Tax=Rhopalosiphum padi TaxID=40932 RepID=UPI00298D9DBA|nr:serine-rich adhesin for platelets-like [Rhopalosiphum padi]